MDNLPETLPAVSRPLTRFGEEEALYEFILRVKRWGAGIGLHEAENYSFVGQKDLDLLGLPAEGRIAILNPLSEDQNVLRTELTPGLLLNVRHNLAHSASGVRLFEVANAFHADPASETTAREDLRLAVALYGPARESGWPDLGRFDADADYADLRGVVDSLMAFLHLPAPMYDLAGEHPYLAPCLDVRIRTNQTGQDALSVGRLGRVQPKIADTFHARKAIWTAELDLALLRRLAAEARIRFALLPVYPAVSRDITVIAPPSLRVGRVLDTVRETGVRFLEQVALQDIYEPENRDERNLTFRLAFRHPERTLKDSEVDKERERVIKTLVEGLGVRV